VSGYARVADSAVLRRQAGASWAVRTSRFPTSIGASPPSSGGHSDGWLSFARRLERVTSRASLGDVRCVADNSRRSEGLRRRNRHDGERVAENSQSPSQLIDARIEELGDWRGELLGRLRALVKAADPEIVEEWKWRGVPVWSHDGLICTGETYKNVVKMTFAKGAALQDPSRLFNASLEGNTRRAIDFHEGETIDSAASTALVRAAVALNKSKARR
jgi:hypothetical protein